MFGKFFRSRLAAIFAVVAVIAAMTIPAAAHEGREVGDLNFVVGFLNEPAIEGQPNAASVRITGHDDNPADGHGELFTSLAIASNEYFEFTFDSSLIGSTVGYHIHPVELEGSVTVSETAEVSGTTTVHVMAGGLNPSNLAVQPGTLVRFHNMTGAEMVVMSGSVAAMTGAEMDMGEGETALEVEIRHLPSGESMTAELEERFNDPGHFVANFIPTAPGTYEFRVFGTAYGTEVDETFTGGPGTFSDVERASAIQFPVQLAAASEVENAARGAQESADQALVKADDAGSTASLALVFGIVGMAIGVTGAGLGLWGIQSARAAKR